MSVARLRVPIARNAGCSKDGPILGPGDSLTGGVTAIRVDQPVELPASGIDLEQLEGSLVVQALDRTGWSQVKTGALLGLNRDQVRYRIEKFNLQRPTHPRRSQLTGNRKRAQKIPQAAMRRQAFRPGRVCRAEAH